ncbi:glycosyltransferase family 2 protein [Providencia sp. PROV130]|uniref:glycosyltransferase family 2 protein n=1 Tax=Providencia sp. PROV130 TaxID=2949840 RepID=UPI00234AA266|nr:glycosyltransferase [Providencia sp. PROV130]
MYSHNICEMTSVVITTKDRWDFLLRAIDSIVSSTVLPKYIVIVNDGEKIEKENLLNNIPKNIQLTLINNEYSKGANASRNIGISNCVTDLIFLLDDDDALTLRSIEDRLSVIKKSPNTVIAYTGVQFVYSNNLEQVKRTLPPHSLSHDSNQNIKALLKNGNLIGSTSRACIRKKAFLLAGQFDENLTCLQDYDLWLRMSKLGNIEHDNKSNVIYTIHCNGKQISSQHQKYLTTGFILYNKYKDDINKLKLQRKFLSQIYLRVAIITSRYSTKNKIKYCLTSLRYGLKIKTLLLLILPSSIIKKIHPYN